jgi:ElaA protein
MKWFQKTFEELTSEELYSILLLRTEVFVVEQDCVYQDIDNKDQKAIHLFATENETVVAYARIFKAGDYFKEASIGRVVVKPTHRRLSLGIEVMKKSIKFMEKHNYGSIHISAQKYLQNFYEGFGFRQVTDEYLEDDIPHIGMQRKI